MTTQTAGTSVHASVLVEAPIGHAFTVFTEQMGTWWPPDHHILEGELKVPFVADGPNRTRVDLEHRNLDRHGEVWEPLRDSVGGPEGWHKELEAFAKAAAA